jgi:hypothetical protein
MKIIERYVDALNRHDADAVAVLFSDDCEFYDKAPRLQLGGDICAHGREEIREAFKKLFSTYRVSAVMIVDMGDRAIYNVMLDHELLRCSCLIRQDQGCINKMEITLR